MRDRWRRTKRFLDGPWWRVAAVWWIVSTVLYVAGAWLFFVRIDAPQYRAGDWPLLGIFWVGFSGILVAIWCWDDRRWERRR